MMKTMILLMMKTSIPHDLHYSVVEDHVNVDVMMSADVARGHGGDGGGDDRLPLNQLVRRFTWEFPMHFGSWCNILAERKAEVLGKIGTQFDLKPHMQSELWPEIRKGIDQHLGKIYIDNKSSLKRDYWVKNPDDETYDVKAIRS
ncbi:hypothetical protein Tco_0902267 [Tanacetum coccineum]